jgi:hypothetical protein
MEWNAAPIEGDVAEQVARLKRDPGQNLLIYGSGSFERLLLQHGLLDRLRLMIYPVVLGGRLLLRRGAAGHQLRLPVRAAVNRSLPGGPQLGQALTPSETVRAHTVTRRRLARHSRQRRARPRATQPAW